MQTYASTRAKLLLAAMCSLVVSFQAMAQVPDSTYRKPELPTGPPVPVGQPQPRPRIEEQPKPAPVVVAPQEESEEQEEGQPLRFIDRLYVGGSFGLQFGTFTNISLLPTVSYAFTPKFYGGLGAVYHYASGNGFKLNHYGGRAFTQLELFDLSQMELLNFGDGAILAHAEVEILSIEVPFYDALGRRRTDRSALTIPMIGLGFRQKLSSKGSFDLLVLYNGADDMNNPYNNPVIRFGFNIPLTSR